MASPLESRLAALDVPAHREPLRQLRRGIEKESLRVLPNGALSKRPHPQALGSPLTHPQITIDFSEAQLELITGVHPDVDACMRELGDIHRFVYRHLGDELLWPASMPCVLGSDEDIPVGQFGRSNIGRTKTIYRLGLGWRYGRLMQTISGIHYNFSLPDALWPVLAPMQGRAPDQAFRTDAYFSLIRNFRRHSWLLVLLLGASPAVCKSFVKGKPHSLQCFDEGSLYLPHATSLRMGRLGYQSDAQTSLHVSYNSLADYAGSLRYALTHSYPAYAQIGVKVDGEYRQLNANLLQIENEFYASIRPKRRTAKGQRAVTALFDGGVEYVEVRCLDLNPFLPLGIDAATMRFLDVFLVHCLLTDSPPDSPAESVELARNQRKVVEAGREPGLTLQRAGDEVALAGWGAQLLAECARVATLLDRAAGGELHAQAVASQREVFEDLSRTPSARLLDAMHRDRLPFAHFASRKGLEHKRRLMQEPLAPERLAEFEASAQASLDEQRCIEAAESEGLDEFLARYLAVPEFRPGA
jgi:glutamate--cysteine ligase